MSTKTRSDGEGSIYQRKDGKWVASISLGKDHTGKRMRRTRITKTKKQASIKLRELQNMARDNSLVVDDKITVAESGVDSNSDSVKLLTVGMEPT